ncbi:unnamed protein product [Laminaria digitata]
MTARAFLRLSEGLREAFAAAQDDETLRYLRVEVVDGDCLEAVGSKQKGDLETDFDSLAQEVEEKTPCLFLLALDAHELKVVTGRGGGVPAAVGSGRGGSGGAAAPRLWLLVAWIPDDAKVRAKMLYSSSKQDLRQGLGLGFFEGDYYANVKDDLRFDSLVASRRGGRGDQLLSDAELLKRELNKQERASDTGMKSAAMGVIPFTINPDLKDQLQAFGTGGGDVNWIEMRMDGESIALAGAKTVADSDSLEDLVTEEEPRFILLRREKAKFLVYSCPEESPVRLKMTYSSSKASVVAAAAEVGTTVDHMVEIRAANEIDEAVAHAARDAADQAKGGAGAGGGGGGAFGGERATIVSPIPAVSRPSRPGRGRARLTKRS